MYAIRSYYVRMALWVVLKYDGCAKQCKYGNSKNFVENKVFHVAAFIAVGTTNWIVSDSEMERFICIQSTKIALFLTLWCKK